MRYLKLLPPILICFVSVDYGQSQAPLPQIRLDGAVKHLYVDEIFIQHTRVGPYHALFRTFAVKIPDRRKVRETASSQCLRFLLPLSTAVFDLGLPSPGGIIRPHFARLDPRIA